MWAAMYNESKLTVGKCRYGAIARLGSRLLSKKEARIPSTMHGKNVLARVRRLLPTYPTRSSSHPHSDNRFHATMSQLAIALAAFTIHRRWRNRRPNAAKLTYYLTAIPYFGHRVFLWYLIAYLEVWTWKRGLQRQSREKSRSWYGLFSRTPA